MQIVITDHNLAAAERTLIEHALQKTGQLLEASRLLGITRHALKRRIVKHKIRWTRTLVHGAQSAAA
jgi:DNA-binding NtrC family response regulator